MALSAAARSLEKVKLGAAPVANPNPVLPAVPANAPAPPAAPAAVAEANVKPPWRDPKEKEGALDLSGPVAKPNLVGEEGATGEPNWKVVRGEAPESAAGGEKPPKAGAAAAVPGLANGNPCAVQRSVLSSSLSLCWLV